MAKVHFGKLDLSTNKDVETFEWNGQIIEVKQYLPVEEKFKLINKIINDTADENMFFSPARLRVFYAINVFLAYTNISATETQMKDIGKFYDLLISSGLYAEFRDRMERNEDCFIENVVRQTITKLEEYNTSIYGILDNINSQYGDVQEATRDLLKDISESKDIQLVSDIMTKLG